MKVKIGKYTTWIGVYQIAYWFKPLFGNDRVEEFTDSAFFDKWSDKLDPFMQWIDSKKHRKIKIKIDDYDVWNMGHTMSLIIVPLLIRLKEIKNGSPSVDDDDVPTYLRGDINPMIPNWDDENLHRRWEWVLDEMTWAFTEIRDDVWEEQYHQDGAKYNRVGYIKHSNRILNGRMLFAKYYDGLWD